ncbi:DNA polymerase III subunit delta [Notoacmeibacter sp. MSK16QG-6]|uniref:DNA polymerase III subunit delta n=1 Tax=Notoacmeibacter sp. MSK16QG-6 TaxID=2957982 RepID=UPI00209F9D65|nr:DNA polymerase III subunit delta [Notoacmeibacter sp. MSK16QG-6]MCP1199114.1 DNA polymerase III subunit delta [Notoacmeibacter sp. MSK16QG-6]
MATRKAHEVDSWIARPDPRVRTVLIYGPDRGLVSERAKRFARETGLDLDDPFAVIRLEGSEVDADPARLADEARTVSMFGGERLIWLRNAGSSKGFLTAISDLLADPPSDARLLIEAGDLKRAAGNLRGLCEKAESAMALPCYADKARDLEKLIQDVLGGAGLALQAEARSLLMNALGGDRLASRGELEKLALYADGQAEVTAEDVIASIGDVAALSADTLVDAALTGNLTLLDRELGRLVQAGTDANAILATLIRAIGQLHELRLAMDKRNLSASAAVQQARPPVFFTRRQAVTDALSAWSSDRIAAAQDRIHDTVLTIRKSGRLEIPTLRHTLLALAIEARRKHRAA